MWEALGLSGEVGVDYVTRYCYFTSSSSPPTGYAQEEQLKEEEEIKEEEGEELPEGLLGPLSPHLAPGIGLERLPSGDACSP